MGKFLHGNGRRRHKTKAYVAWMSMWRRCTYPSQDNYYLYGGRGISVCPRWKLFVNFLADMGDCPSGMTLERNDTNGNYELGNCKWATRLAQARNKRGTRWLTFKGETLCLTEWAERTRIKPKTLRARLDDHGWSVERALSQAIMSSSEAGIIGSASRWHK